MATTPTDKAAQWLDDAAQAVRDWGAAGPEDMEQVERHARREVDLALSAGHTAAAIAATAGVRQLLVAGLVDAPRQRAAALVDARHDAERYLEQVRAEVRAEAIRRWYAATEHGDADRGTKASICTELGVARTTLNEWLSGL